VNPPIGGTTPSFGATIRPQQWNVDFHGNFIWYGSAGIGTDGRTGATAFHLPGRGDDGYETPNTEAYFGFTVSQGPLVSSVNYNTDLDAYNFEMVYTPAVAPGWQLELIFGDTGRGFGGPVGLVGTGVRTRTEWQADTYLGLVFEQGVLFDSRSALDRGNAVLGQFYSVDADYDGVYNASVAFVTRRFQDAEPVKQMGEDPLIRLWTADQVVNQGALSLRWFGEDLGEVNLGLQYTRTLDWARDSLGSGRGDRGSLLEDALGARKAALTGEAGYSLSIFRFLDPSFYDPDGRDLKASVNLSYVKPLDPLPIIAKLGDYYSVGLGLSYRIFGGVRVWADYNIQEPSVKLEDKNEATQKFSTIETNVEFKTAPLSPEYFQISWAHEFHAKAWKPKPLNPGDTERFEFRAGMFW